MKIIRNHGEFVDVQVVQQRRNEACEGSIRDKAGGIGRSQVMNDLIVIGDRLSLMIIVF